ncbi:MAG TPA: BTAD domain-containing putative transcriptional regulator, partial [Propionibacteriaceae bacterium]|nr:BTAD domain-containing putative transcriptional regulator [Propionibacteriaceae bacterium]
MDLDNIEGALAEWTGTPLAGLEAPGLAPAVDGLVEQWLAAVEIDLDHRLQTNPTAAIGPLTELTANHPFREGLWSLLMTALYRVGRQADALDAYQRARHHLVEQLGVEPGPRLRELESLVLGQDEQLRGPERSTVPASGQPTGTVTFGFCEVEDSGRLWATHRKKMAAAVSGLDVLVRAVVCRHGGYVFATGGESFGAAFHRADDAAAWARELQLEVTREPWPGGVELRLRIGLHSGETEERAGSYFGSAVNAARQIAAVGHGGQILVSEVTSALLDRNVVLDLGTYRLRDEVAGVRILQLDEGRHPPLRTEDGRRGNLPISLDRLHGRGNDLEVIVEALSHSPVVTLVGPGGIGKTRLALAVCMSDADAVGGVWLIELASIASSSDVPRAVADVLQVKEGPGRSLTQSVIAALQSRSALVLLDNCEHVIDGAAELVQAMVQRCPHVRVLATSREPLGVSGEQLIAVEPLDAAGAAVELFNERARAMSATFDAAASGSEVEEICRRLDGVPLAIELAAARTRTLTPSDLVDRLGHRLHLLTGGRRIRPERQRTLRATIQWSYDLLAPAQQTLFQRLSVFAGPFTLEGAGSVAAGEDLDRLDIDDLLQDLVEKSMLTVVSGRLGRLFRLLETMREFAAEQLGQAGSADLIAERHAQWCLARVTDIHHLLVGQAEIEGVALLDQLWPNLRAAFDWACTPRTPQLAAALVRPVAAELNLRQQTEIRDWAERILAVTPPTEEDETAYWLVCATYGYKQNGDHQAYERLVHRYGKPDHPLVRYTRAYLDDDGPALLECSREAVGWLRSHGLDQAALHVEIAGVASGLMSTGHFGELDAFVAPLVDRYRTQGPPTLLYVTLAMLGYSALFQGKTDTAEQLFDESASIDVPDRTSSVNEPAQARAALRRGDQSQAFRILRSYVEELLETDYTDLARNAAIEFINIMT